MKIEDVTINHIRRADVVTIEDGHKKITSIPVGFEDEVVQVGDSNRRRWHDKETCPDILGSPHNYYSHVVHSDYWFKSCYGECVPNQKIIPWNMDRFVYAWYNFIAIGYKTKRTVKFTSGDEISYYKEYDEGK